MDDLLNLQFYLRQLDAAHRWLAQNAVSLSLETLGQIIVVGVAFMAARQAKPWLQAVLLRASRGRRYEAQIARIAAALAPLTLPIIWLSLQWLSVLIATEAALPSR